MNRIPLLIPLLISLGGVLSSNVYATEQTDITLAKATTAIYQPNDRADVISAVEASQLLAGPSIAINEQLTAQIERKLRLTLRQN